MTEDRNFAPPPSVHVEVFVTRRSQRDRVRRRCRALYSVVRTLTRKDGGAGPYLFLLDSRSRHRLRPEDLRAAMGAKPGEDVWFELTFYRNAELRKRTLRKLWAMPEVARLAEGAEALTLRRKRTWLIATGAAR